MLGHHVHPLLNKVPDARPAASRVDKDEVKVEWHVAARAIVFHRFLQGQVVDFHYHQPVTGSDHITRSGRLTRSGHITRSGIPVTISR